MQEEPLKKDFSWRKIVEALIFIILMPATIFFGMYVLGDRKFYFISIVMIIFTMIPFFWVFENRKPKAREIIVIAVLAAIAVAGRMAFFMIPQFKPVMAIVIIAGVSFGGEAGFLTGALTAFVSNFFFGQGPWTPWQMFAFGIVGFIAGVIFKNEKLKSNRIALCIFGGIATLVIYGGLINISALFMASSKITIDGLIATYASGLPFDLIHAGSTIIFLFLISKPMIEKLNRIKIKYGLL
ncbi:MAG: ECF transporter S component [Clostridiaceae bacterium]|nr:ECF transporter S component [Clostridiaceae bacterium]